MKRTTTGLSAARLVLAGILVALIGLALAPVAGAQQFTWLPPATLAANGGSHSANAVACPNANQCTAVDADGQQVTFDPTTGAISHESAVDVVGQASGVACPTNAQCTAVDGSGNEVTFNPLTGAVVGGGLQTVETNTPPNTPVSALSSVSCPSATLCVAVDHQGREYGFDPTTNASSDGGHQLEPANAPPTAGPVLSSVSCSATTCVTVDDQGNEVTFDPTTGVGAVHSVDGSNVLTSVSCIGVKCVAVDSTGNVVRFDSSTGATSGGGPQPIDAGTPLTSVACQAANNTCTAVDHLGQEFSVDLISNAPVTSHSVDGIAVLNSVACPSAGQCTAVDNQGQEVTFDPQTGNVIAGGPHSVDPQSLVAMSCPTATQCTALDGSREITFDPTRGVITGKDGNGNPGPSIIDTTSNALTSISCPTATQCTAVDRGPFAFTFNPVDGRLNAASENTPNADIEPGRSLQGVSCPEVHQCTAVDTTGNQVTFNPQLGFVGVNGVSPNQIDPSSSDKVLISVVCLTDTSCVAIDRAGNEITFDPTSINSGTPTSVEHGQRPTAMSCPSSTQCTAVDDGGRAFTFDPSTVASTQNDIAGPTSIDGTTPLTAVSCPASTQCVAVDGAAKAVAFNPTSLAGATAQPVGEAAALLAVSCPSAFECAAGDARGNAFGGFLPPASTTPPTITGTVQQGQTLTEHHGTFANYPASTYALQWEDCDDSGCSPIPGATGSTYVLQPSDVGEQIAVQETATNLGGDSPPASSARTAPVLPLPPANLGPPAIVGTVAQGQVLTEHHGQWTNNPTSFAVQWASCDGSGLSCAPIPGATGQSYEPQASDIGRTLVVQETAGNAGGTSSSVTSAPTAAVASARAADVRAVTYVQTALAYGSAMLHGVAYTQGAPASWQFRYGTTTALASATPAQAVGEGNTTEIPAQAALSGLRPDTTYYVRLVVDVSAGPYRTAVQALGNIVRFRTPLVGSLHLHGTQVPVSGHRGVLGLDCRAPVRCAARLSITASHWIGTGRHRHRQVIRCATANTAVSANRSRQVGLSLSGGCVTLIRAARHHVLAASLVATSTSGQHGFTHGVQLRG